MEMMMLWRPAVRQDEEASAAITGGDEAKVGMQAAGNGLKQNSKKLQSASVDVIKLCRVAESLMMVMSSSRPGSALNPAHHSDNHTETCRGRE